LSAIGFYLQVIHALEDIQAPYMIVGAFAGLAYGITRATFDVDILVDLRGHDFNALAERFPSPRYYADPEMMRNSTRAGIMFNIIDSEMGVKADLVPLTREPEYEAAFARPIDYQSVSVQAARMGTETSKLWQELLARARRESGSAQ
jgi:hypothetical protein